MASATSANYATGIVTPTTITFTGSTHVTSQMNSFLFNAPTLTDASALTVDNAATLDIAGAVGLIVGSGSVGIGTAAPAAKLDVSCEVRVSSSGGTCSSTNSGAQRYTGATDNWCYCDGNAWVPMTNPPTANGLESHWKLDSSTADATGNGNTGTLIGSPTYATGYINNAITLNGTNVRQHSGFNVSSRQ